MIQFSIVTPVYNKEQFLSDTLNSVLSQTHTQFELLLLNDGSTDKSQQIIDSFHDDRIKVYQGENTGAGAARNFLTMKAKYSYIAFLDADDLWKENHLEEMARLIKKYPLENFFATNTIKTIEKTTIYRNYSIDIKNVSDIVTDFFEASYLDCILITSATVINKEVFEKIGGYNTNIKSGQDIDLYIRLSKYYKIVFSTCVTATIVGNSKSLSNTTDYKEKMSFEKVFSNELTNKKAKKYYDLNRYALAVVAKEQGYKASFLKLISLIDFKNLHWKQRLILKMPKVIIRFLLRCKAFLFSKGFYFTVYK